MFQPHPKVTFQNLGATTVLVHLETNRAYELNETGGRCWALLCEGCDRAAIKDRLLQEFDITETQLDNELNHIFELLANEQLLVERPAE